MLQPMGTDSADHHNGGIPLGQSSGEALVQLAACARLVAHAIGFPRDVGDAEEIEIAQAGTGGCQNPRRALTVVERRIHRRAHQVGVEHDLLRCRGNDTPSPRKHEHARLFVGNLASRNGRYVVG